MDQRAYIQLTTDEPINTVAFYQEIRDFMVYGREYVDDTMILLSPGVVTTLKGNTHYMVGVVNLRTGVTYSMKIWREEGEFSRASD